MAGRRLAAASAKKSNSLKKDDPVSRKKRILDSTKTLGKVVTKDNFKNKGKTKTKPTATIIIKNGDGIIIQKNSAVNGSAALRSSSRSRLQSIPYQSPESVMKISAVFTKSSSNNQTSNHTIESLNTSTGKSRVAFPTVSQPPITKSKAPLSNGTSGTKKAAQSPSRKSAVQPTSASRKRALKTTVNKSPAKRNLAKNKVVKAIQKKAGKTLNKSTSRKLAGTKVATPRKSKGKGKPSTDGTAKPGVPRKRKLKDEEDVPEISGGKKKKRVSKNTKKSEKPEKLPKVKPPKPAKKSRKRGAVLDPKPDLPIYDKDPFFESTESIPSISTLADSRLLFRAIFLKDNSLLQSILSKKKSRLCTLAPPRSIAVDRTPISYALQFENVEAIKILVNSKAAEGLGSRPELLLEERSSQGRGGGSRNRMMFGHALRDVTVGRGGKEGNHAFSYDEGLYINYLSTSNEVGDLKCEALTFGVKYETLEKLNQIKASPHYAPFLVGCMDAVINAIRAGHIDTAGPIVQAALIKDGYGFNQLHVDVLTKKGVEALTPFKSVSVVKKAMGNARVTPLHCAAVNPNAKILAELLNSKPEIQVVDSDNWTVLHYAAVCKGTGPLEFLLQRGGISLTAVTKKGDTPLTLACELGRVDNAKLIIEKELSTIAEREAEREDMEVSSGDEAPAAVAIDNKSTKKTNDKDTLLKFAGTSLILANKEALTPLHVAARQGHVEILRALLNIPGMDVNKNIPAQQDKLTPLMLACQRGHLNVVKYFAEERETLGLKFELQDRRGRTALAHAVMNGHAHILSYLLRLGVNHLTKDSSGNALVHYAAAYGWYFNLKLLLEAGCPVGEGNQWKMTPVAIAFMKGHIGLVQYLMDQPGVDINSPVNDSTGVTLLMEACQSRPSKDFYDRIVFLMDKMGADSNMTDFKKNNCLHKLVENEAKYLHAGWIKPSSESSSIAYSKSQEQKYLFKAVKLLMDRGCSPIALNDSDETPISLAFKSTPCFDLLCEIFESKEARIPLTSNQSGNNILHSITPWAISTSSDTFLKKLLINPTNLKHLTELAAQVNRTGYTPLLLFFQNLTTTSNSEELARAKYFLSVLLDKLNSNVNSVVLDKTRDSLLHLVARSPNGKQFISNLLTDKKLKFNLEVLNCHKRTPLVAAILSYRVETAHALIAAGANVNVKVFKEDGNDEGDSDAKSLLLHVCETTFDSSFKIVPILIEKGAVVTEVDSKTGNSPLHFIAKRPNHKGALESIEMILKKGFRADCVNKAGRTPLHFLVNARGGETDVSYDLEDILIEKAPGSLAIQDSRGRIPLHYAFVKIGNFNEKTFMDPIELVGIIVQGMRDNKVSDLVKSVDIFGSMPLHYAARRGATISASFLINETSKAYIDVEDNFGNTPFGLSVLNGHEGCALAFQQLNGNFTLSLNTDQKMVQGVQVDEKDEERWAWAQVRAGTLEKSKQSARDKISTVLEQVVSKDWQGILYLMLETLKNSGASAMPGIHAAIKTRRLKLALKLIERIKNGSGELKSDGREGTLLHMLAKYRHLAPHANRDDEGLKIFSSLISKGVDLAALDRFKSTALIHAAKVRDYGMCFRIWEEMNKKTNHSNNRLLNEQDVFGRTSFSALFWHLGNTDLDKDLKNWVVTQGHETNVLCRYPLRLSKYPGVRYFRLGLDEDTDENVEGAEHLLSPLIVAVLYRNYSVVKWLLDLRGRVDVNFQDGQGRTAIMHAVRLNDIKMVKLLLNPKAYKPHEDNIPWESKSWFVHQSNHQINLTLRDKKGLSVVDHLVSPSSLPFSYAQAHQILKILHKVNRTIVTSDVLESVLRQNKQHLAQTIQELQGVNRSKHLRAAQEFPELIRIKESGPGAEGVKPDFMEDAQNMATRLIAEAEAKELEKNPNGQFRLIPDPLIGSDADDYEIAIENDQPFDVVLTKVDISYGMYGLYNFYKMQLLTQPKGKGMILLFTRWGRIGDEGQYQKTPFGSLEEAVKEFKKIFRSKSGNSWEDLNGPIGFVPISKKYRMVHKDLRNRKQPREVKVDFPAIESFGMKTDFKGSEPTGDLIKDLSLLHNNRYSILSDCDANELPFGQLTIDSLAKGDELLKQIEVLLEQHKKLCVNYDHSKEEEQKIMEQLVELSEEYYSIVPVFGFNAEKLSPIFTSETLRERQELIYNFLHLEFATQLLLGSHFNSTKLPSANPYEYIYSCLGTKIESLSPQEDEAQLVLQYIHNTSERESHSSTTVKKIFRVERQEEMSNLENLDKTQGIRNRWLLWHGTKSVNLLSILSRGLQVAPIGAQLSGHLFGKGIYFADMFEKSQKYCEGTNGVKYMLLCEVSLGKVHPVTLQNNDDSPTGLPSGCHSVVTADSQYEPDPGTSIVWKGRTVPLGKRTTKVLGKDQYFGLSFNEYIIFNPEQVRIKYLVQFSG